MLIIAGSRTNMMTALANDINAGVGDSELQLLTAANVLLASTVIDVAVSGDNLTDSTMADDNTPGDGTVAKYRLVDGDGTVVVESASVGVVGSGEELEITSLTVQNTVPVKFNSLTLTSGNTAI